MIVLGIDPSLSSTGFALVQFHKNQYFSLNLGEIKTKTTQKLSERLAIIFQKIAELIKEYAPDEVAVEEVFYAANPKIALLMGHARGAALVAAAKDNLPVSEYSPREIKMAVTGYGNASKEQVKKMVYSQIYLESDSFGYDVSDALAVVICHCHRSNGKN